MQSANRNMCSKNSMQQKKQVTRSICRKKLFLLQRPTKKTSLTKCQVENITSDCRNKMMSERRILFSTVNELKLIWSFKRRLHSAVLPQFFCVLIELLQNTSAFHSNTKLSAHNVQHMRWQYDQQRWKSESLLIWVWLPHGRVLPYKC